jgi:hypothetical protein
MQSWLEHFWPLGRAGAQAQEAEELRAVLLNILTTGLLRIRAYGWNGQVDLCALEADHLHNLPN